MDLKDFYALKSGPAPSGDETYQLRVVDLGHITITSGQLEACDPFVGLGDMGGFPAPNGTFPVKVTIADLSETHQREAYLSVIFSDAEPVTVTVIEDPEADPDDDEEDSTIGVPVDAGTVAFVDALAAANLRDWVEANNVDWDEIMEGRSDSWFAQMDDPNHYAEGMANIKLPNGTQGENLVLCHSGWGDGFYSVLKTIDAFGNLVAYHIDLEVVGPMEDEDDD